MRMTTTWRVLSVVCAVVGLWASPASAQVVATPADALSWEYTGLEQDMVSRFEVSYNDGEWIDAGVRPVPGAPARYFHPLPALISGTNVARVRACNVIGCGEPSDPFSFPFRASTPGRVDSRTMGIIANPEAPQP